MMDIEKISPWKYPPYPYLESVAYHCPKATSTYMWLWAHKDKNHKLTLDISSIPYVTQHPKATFNNNLIWLVRERLINVKTKAGVHHIELVTWDEE